MIVRIFGDGQYRVADDVRGEFNELDRAASDAVDANEEARFHAAFAALIDAIHAKGERLADDELMPSDLMLPPSDLSLEEARSEFTGEGLIPD